MASIFAVSTKYKNQYIGNPWRDDLVPAAFRGAEFHCEANSLESGRRLVQHEFPKRDINYCEDMGHKAISWTVRGYLIVYPVDVTGSDLYQRDYRTARDALYRVLADGQAGVLQTPTYPPISVWCQRFRFTEEDKLGGYCTVDMTFFEAGTETYALQDTRTALINTSTDLRDRVVTQLIGVQTGVTTPIALVPGS
jgi:prophage DNA circulation protein